MRQRQAEFLHDLAHGLLLRGAADAGDREADVDRGTYAGMEQLRLQIDLTVGNRDHVGRNIGGDIARHRLHDGQSGERAAAVCFAEVSRALQQAGVQIEYVSGVRFASRRTMEQQRHGTVGHGVLAQVVVDDQRGLSVIHKLFGNGAARVGRKILHGSAVACVCDHDDGILHRACGLKRFVDLRDGGEFLPDGDIDAVDVLSALVDDCVHRDGGLARLPVADDQLALTTSDGDDAVHREKAGHERLVDRLTVDDARRRGLDRTIAGGIERFIVQRHTDGVHDAA